MNFLQICQAAVREARIPGGGPSAVTGQVNLLGDFVNWVRDSWLEIQGEKPWDFLRASKTVNLIATRMDYSITGTGVGDLDWQDLRRLDEKNQLILTRAATGAKSLVSYMTWTKWRQQYALATDLGSGPPNVVTITPEGNLRCVPVPDAADSIEIPYWKQAVSLADPNDIPAIVADLHMVIAWRAVKRFAASKGAAAIYTNADTKETPLYHQLMGLYLPVIEVPAAPIT